MPRRKARRLKSQKWTSSIGRCKHLALLVYPNHTGLRAPMSSALKSTKPDIMSLERKVSVLSISQKKDNDLEPAPSIEVSIYI